MTQEHQSGNRESRTISRRQLLYAACGVVPAAGLAGCNGRGVSQASGERLAAPPSALNSEQPDDSADCGVVEDDLSAPRHTKTERTIYTDDRIRNARENIQEFDWAKERRDTVLARADAFLDAYSMDDIWHLVTGQNVPRASAVDAQRRVGSPTEGSEIYTEYSRYPWIIDETESPWKLTDPMSGMRYPTNDFASYLKSGQDNRGFFDPELADDRHLVNELYPDKGREWGVDDGTGWVDENGRRFTFVAYYNHFAVWSSRQSRWGLSLMAPELGRAYLFTGQRKYARAAAIILDRIADEYPNMTLAPYQTEDGFANSHGGTGYGRILGSEWETRLVERLLDAYDAIFPLLLEDDWIVSFLSRKADSHDLWSKSSSSEIREHIETRLFRQVREGVERAEIRGNFGTHQSALAKSAVVLDDPEGYSGEMLDYLFRGGSFEETECGPEVDGGNVLPRLVGVIDRDGHNSEGAPNYHQLALERTRDIADVLDGYESYDGAALYDNVKVEQMHAGQPPLQLLNQYQPSIGDSGRTGRPANRWMQRDTMVDAYDRYRDEEYAQMAYLMNYNTVDGIHGGLFDPEPDQIRADITEVIEAEGPLDLPSQTLAGFGFTALRQGTPEDDNPQRAAWLYYGRNYGHGHQDTLNLGIAANGLMLSPDFGYPAQTGPSPKRINWTANTISHNTVVVDEGRQEYQWVAEPKRFDETDLLSVVDVEAPDVYPQTESYRRTTAMIRIDEESSYVVDFFRVDGGDDHQFSFHGAEGELSTDGLDLFEQSTGTYAGRDIPKPGKGENTEYNQSGDHTGWGGRQFNNGFNYLYDVARDSSPAEKFSMDWDVVDTWGAREDDGDVHLRLTMLGDTDEVAVASGDPPDRSGNPDSLRYLLAHRTGTDLRSTFTSVIEPYEQSRAVDSIESVPVRSEGGSARAVAVKLDSGRTDYVVSTTDPDATYRVDDVFAFSGAFAVYSEKGTPEYAYVLDGDRLTVDNSALVRRRGPRLEGSVVDISREFDDDNHVIIEVTDGPTEVTDSLAGNWIYVDTDSERNGAYRIDAVGARAGDRMTLSLGGQTLVRGLSDPQDLASGYEYNVEVGDQFRIPLSSVWSNHE